MEELYKLIEDYLNDRLPQNRRREVEQRMAEDEAFRREVHLHQAMQEEFNDARGWNLYASLRDIMEEGENTHTQDNAAGGENQGRKIWWWMLPLFLGVVGAVVWYGSNPPGPASSFSPAPGIDTLPNNNDSLPEIIQDTLKTGSDSSSVIQPKNKRLYAFADPRNFEPNTAMETYIRNKDARSSGGIKVDINAPPPAAHFSPGQTGHTPLQITGVFKGLKPRENTAFTFNIFDNKNINDPRRSIPLIVGADASGSANFDLQKTIQLRPGLYYYQVEEAASGDVLITGKFFIGAAN